MNLTKVSILWSNGKSCQFHVIENSFVIFDRDYSIALCDNVACRSLTHRNDVSTNMCGFVRHVLMLNYGQQRFPHWEESIGSIYFVEKISVRVKMNIFTAT